MKTTPSPVIADRTDTASSRRAVLKVFAAASVFPLLGCVADLGGAEDDTASARASR